MWIDIKGEISGELYYRLIDFAVGKFPLFVCVGDWDWKKSVKSLPEGAEKVIEELSPFLVERFFSNEWPGTRIYEGKAEVFYFNLTSASASILKKHASSLYQWKLPELPQDMSIMRNSKQPWLCNVAHDDFSTLFVTPEEKNELLKVIPELSEYLGEEGKPTSYYV